MSAIFEIGGKQYLVKEGDKVQIEKIDQAVGESISLDKVLFTEDGDKYSVGKPYIAGAVITAKVLKQGRGKKVEVLKYKAKSKYRKKIGHRQAYTEIEIVKI